MEDASPWRSVDYVRYELSDFHGISRSKVLPSRLLLVNDEEETDAPRDVFLYGGFLGMSTISEPVMLPDLLVDGCCRNLRVRPSKDTFRVLPRSPGAKYSTGRVLCELDWSGDGELLDAQPRTLARKLLGELEDLNLQIFGCFEYEFTLGTLDAEGKFTPLFRDRPTFSTFAFSKLQDLVYDLDHELREIGVEVNTMNIEYGQGQLEITTRPLWGIEIADSAFTFKNYVKEFFARRGFHATFMCRPLADPADASNGGHFNHSIHKTTPPEDSAGGGQGTTRNAFHSEGSADLSALARMWICGLLSHSRALQALAAPTVSCSNRVKPWSWAPTNASWGVENRTCALRAKCYGEKGTYLEWRAPSASANPYLVLAGAVAAGLDGVSKCIDVDSRSGLAESAYEKDDLPLLPGTLGESLACLEDDAILCDRLGTRFVRWFLHVKREEIKDVKEKTPSLQWCQERYLDLL